MLEEYYVYSMDDQVAKRYYYKSDLLFRFLKTCTSVKQENAIAKQFTYVTHTLSMKQLVDLFKQTSFSVQVKEEGNELFLTSGKKHAHLSIHKNHIKIMCSSIFDAEKLVFQPLRLFPTHLFVVHAQKRVYGWISIVKDERAGKARETL